MIEISVDFDSFCKIAYLINKHITDYETYNCATMFAKIY